MAKWVLAAIIALALIAGIGYAAMSVGIVTLDSPTERGVKTAQATSTRTLADIMANGGSYVCTFATEDSPVKNNGTLYISGENVRGDFEAATDASEVMRSHVVQYGGYLYTWSDATLIGAKAPRDKVQATSSTAMGRQHFDMNAARAYICEEWIPDLTKYDLPRGVKFTEVK